MRFPHGVVVSSVSFPFLSLIDDERGRLFMFRLFTLSQELSLRVIAVVGVVVDVDDELAPVVA